jgi:hypothetical protein
MTPPRRARPRLLLAAILTAFALIPPACAQHSAVAPDPQIVLVPAAPFAITVLRRGTEIEFRGAILPGATRMLAEFLRGPGKGARVLHLISPGGSVVEGLGMAALVRRHRLETYARAGQCDSACTFVFLAGRERHLRSGRAKLGFQPGPAVR